MMEPHGNPGKSQNIQIRASSLGQGVLPFVFALDQKWSEAQLWVERLGSEIWGFKVGSILFTEEGPAAIRYLKSKGRRVFLDLKFHDIPNTVSGAVKAAFDLGVDWLTVHAAGGQKMLEAIAPLQNQNQKILAISVLTSLEESDTQTLGWNRPIAEQVKGMANLAMSSGIEGLVSSPHEVEFLRAQYKDALLITPGVRFSNDRQDQKRTATAEQALKSGSSCIVLGRALSESKNWESTWQEIKSSLDAKS